MKMIKKITATIFALALVSFTFQNCNRASGTSGATGTPGTPGTASSASTAGTSTPVNAAGSDVEKQLHDVADKLNKTCPMNVDKDTRLDNVMAMPENGLMYSYTLVNYDKSQVDTNQLRTYIQPKVVENMKTNPDMKYMRDNKVTLIYEYKDKNGAFLFKVAATPAQYQQ